MVACMALGLKIAASDTLLSTEFDWEMTSINSNLFRIMTLKQSDWEALSKLNPLEWMQFQIDLQFLPLRDQADAPGSTVQQHHHC